MTSLVEKLKSESTEGRIQAAVALGYERPSGTVHALLEQLAREKHVRVAAACCAALEMIGDAGAVPELVRLLERCPADQVWDLSHAIGRMTGVSPIVAPGVGAETLRGIWLAAVPKGAEPSVTSVSAD